MGGGVRAMPDTQVGLALLGHVVVLRDKSDKDMLLDAIRPFIPVSRYFDYNRPCFYIAREGSRGAAANDTSDREIVLRSCERNSGAFNIRIKINLSHALDIISEETKFKAPTDEEFVVAFDTLLT